MADSLVRLLSSSLEDHRDRPAFTDEGGATLTYADVSRQIARLHAAFRAAHVKRGDAVALLGRNSPAWATVYLATVTYGAVIVPILPDFRRDDVHHIVNHSGAVLLFAADSLATPLDPPQMKGLRALLSLTDFRVVSADRERTAGALEDALGAPAGAAGFEDVAENETAAIVYTSGTTGFSKGVLLSHRSLLVNVLFARRHMPLRPGDTIVSFLPLAHAFGCAFEFLYPAASGCAITFVGQMPAPKVLLGLFRSVRPRLILTVPLVLEKIYRKQIRPVLERPTTRLMRALPGLRTLVKRRVRDKLVAAFGGNFREIVVGGAPLAPEVEDFLMESGFPLTTGYGMTECGPLISYSAWTEHRKGSVGRVIDALELRIESQDPRRVPGEVLVRGANVMTGYHRNPEATREALDADGWLHTGDLGVLDEGGHLYLRGRSKTLLVGPSGQNVYPEEIEARLNALPYVGESLVVEKGGRLVALVYPDLERVDAEHVGEAGLHRILENHRLALNARLPPWAAVSRVELWPEEFEKTPTRKIKRFLYTQSS